MIYACNNQARQNRPSVYVVLLGLSGWNGGTRACVGGALVQQ